MAEPREKKLKTIKTGAFSRGVAIAKLSAAAGARAMTHGVSGLWAEIGGNQTPELRADRARALLMSQIQALSGELGELKGSLMKAGQMLSVMGEQFLPPEINAVLKTLQNQSPSLEWAAIEKVLQRQLGPRLAELEIETTPLASASLGQVHLARRRSDGERIALKVQYPGVDRAIDSDIKTLKRFLGLAKLLPLPSGSPSRSYDELFAEVRQMLLREVDYRQELESTDRFRARLEGDARYSIARTFPEYSTGRVLATAYQEGVDVDGAEVQDLPQSARDQLGLAALDLYFQELFVWGEVQTDPHFGNYRIRPRTGQLVLLDFGATRKLPEKFLKPYFKMLRGCYEEDRRLVVEGAREIDFLREDDTEEARASFYALCRLFTEPFAAGVYDWGKSDLPKRVARDGSKLAWQLKLRTPPREVIFLDRKMGGVFIFLSRLGARIDARALLGKYVTDPPVLRRG